MNADRNELHALIDRIREPDLAVARKLLKASAKDWDVASADSEGLLTDQARCDVEAAEQYFDRGGEGVAHKDVLKEFDLA